MYNNNGGQTGPSKGTRLSFLTPTDQAKFEQIFSQGAAAFGGNKISANAVSELLRRSNLDNDSLAKIWDLASIANSPYLSFPEFAVAMFLTSKKLTGQTLPASLPPNVREETELAMATIASTETSQQLVNTQQPQQQQQFMNPQQPMMTGMPSQGMMSSQPTGMMSSQPTGMMPSQPTGMMPSQQMNMMTGMNMNHQLRPTPSPAPQQPMQTGYMGSYQSPMQTGFMPPQPQPPKPRLQNLDFAKKMMPNQNGVTNLLNPNLGTSEANKLSWKISPEDKQRYRDIFNAWEGSGSGFMSGDTAKDVLTQSQLPPQDLMKIWNLADSENRGSLDVDEFAVAMHLVYRKLNGFEIPNTLPAELKPPSSLLKKFVLGRRPPPSTPSFNTPPPKQEEYDDGDDYHRDDYISSSRRKGPQSSSSSRYHRYQEEDEVDVALLEDLRRQISDTKRTLDRMPRTTTTTSTSNHSSKYSLEELKEKIRRTQDELNQLSRNNPLSSKYLSNSDTLLDLLETEKSLQDEIQYLCNRDIPILARQVRGAAAELRDTKVRHARKNDGTQDFMAFIQPTGPGGSITESDRVRAKAKSMMAARKAGNSGSSTDAGYGLRRAEEEKEEADKKADSIERDMERSRTALLDMRGDLRYLEEMTAAQDLEDKKRFEMGGQDLSYELRRFIEQLDTKSEPVSSYGTSRHQSFERSTSASSIGYQSPSVASPVMSNTSSPKPKPAPARPRTAEEIKKEAERRVQERLAALQAKRNPGSSPRSISKPSTPSTPSTPFSKPDASEERQYDTEREAQETLRNTVNQREESDRRNREAELDRIREQERLDRQRSEEAEREAERARKETEEDEKRREEQEEREFQERRRKIVEKEEADRQARFDAIRRDEEEAEQRKQEHKPEEAPTVVPEVAPVTATPPPPPPPAPPAPPVAAATPSTPSVPSTPNASTSSNNPFAKFQANITTSPVGSSQAEKPNEPSNKRVSYNPFAAFSAFSATKAGAKDDTDSEDDGWDAAHDDSDDENEFPAAGSAKNLAGMLFTAMSKIGGNNDSLETVREVNSPKPDENDTAAPPPPPPAPPAPAAANGNAPPPPPAPAAPAAPAAPTAPAAPAAPAAGGDSRGALLCQIQSGLKLKKAKTNDRSASSIAGHVIDDGNSPPAPVQPAEPPVEITAPTPVSGALSTSGFLAELQGRTQQESPVAASNVAPVDNTPNHDESLPEHEYVALWDYPGSGADDLVFSQDDVIIVRDNNESEDWWFGTLEKNKKTGYFPRNYVQLKPEADPELNIKVKALYDFEGPEGQGCLSFKMGDTITVLVKENDDWWKAQSEDGTQIGLVPANYLEQI